MSKIFIPEKLKVGFQERNDTFTKRLAYVIYYDAVGKLRKETSWQSWRDKKIEPMEVDNVPTSGFVLNKGHTRYAWSSFGSNRTVIRIYDPRGIEFEITPENLVALMMHTDVSRREIAGELVYAWHGTELMLLPVGTDEYKSAKDYTALQGKRVSAKELKQGATYKTKHGDTLIYLGRYDWWEWVHSNGDYYTKNYRKKRQHIFCGEWPEEYRSGLWNCPQTKDKKWYFKQCPNPTNLIAECASEHCHDSYSNLVEEWEKKIPQSSPEKLLRFVPYTAAQIERIKNWELMKGWIDRGGGLFELYEFGREDSYGRSYWNSGYFLKVRGDFKGDPPHRNLVQSRKVNYTQNKRSYSGYGERSVIGTIGDLSVYGKLQLTYENGKKEWLGGES